MLGKSPAFFRFLRIIPFKRRENLCHLSANGASGGNPFQKPQAMSSMSVQTETSSTPRTFLWEASPGILFKSVSGKPQITLPDDWPEFPKEPGTYYVGITSKDDVGNQSDPFLSSGVFRFIPPPSPSKGGIDSL